MLQEHGAVAVDRLADIASAHDGPEARIEQMAGRRATVHLGGQWDGRSRAAMTEAVTQLIEGRIVDVELDMSRMTAIDQAGVTAIRSGLRRLTAARIPFRSGLASR